LNQQDRTRQHDQVDIDRIDPENRTII
jgi:hypothetical protein